MTTKERDATGLLGQLRRLAAQAERQGWPAAEGEMAACFRELDSLIQHGEMPVGWTPPRAKLEAALRGKAVSEWNEHGEDHGPVVIEIYLSEAVTAAFDTWGAKEIAR